MSGAPGSGGRWLGCLPKQPGLGMFSPREEVLWQLFMPWWVLEGHGSLETSCLSWALAVVTLDPLQNQLVAQLATQHMVQMLLCVAAQE